MQTVIRFVLGITLVGQLSSASAEPAQSPSAEPRAQAAGSGAVSPLLTSSAYVIGASDVLSIVFWRDPDMSAEVTVRPDGKITLPLLKEIPAAGLTPEQLRQKLIAAASEYVEEPNPVVVVKEIHSRNVFITGSVTKPNAYALTGDTTVMQLIAMAGGLVDFADRKHILIIRIENGKQQYYQFNYGDVIRRIHPEQNILLRPGDTVVVP
ncbi:MAG TPA: polysaccharide biosynthesis/export family protein [Vicinamibacterales bacterium]